MSRIQLSTTKWMLITMAMTLSLSACSGSASPADTQAEAERRAAQLAAGTLGLDGSAEAVEIEQAAELVPLWELLAELSTSSTAATEEFAATVEAIEAAMTADQLAAIEAMDVPAAESGSAMEADALPAGEAEAAAEAAQAAAASMDPSLGGEPGGDMAGMPMDGAPPASGAERGPTGRQSASGGAYASVIAALKSKAAG